MNSPYKVLDLRKYSCPMPVLKVKNKLNSLNSGQVLKVMTTDPGSMTNFTALARQAGVELLESSELHGEFHFLMRKE